NSKERSMINSLYSYINSPWGQIYVQGNGDFVTGLYLPNHRGLLVPGPACRRADAPFAAIREQLAEYFAGERPIFDVPCRLSGTPFQQRVWHQLAQIPFGTTITYAQLAERIGQPNAARAVGHANGRNPVAILVPCHRVIGTDGQLTG